MICTECGAEFPGDADEFGDVPDVCPSCVLAELLGDETEDFEDEAWDGESYGSCSECDANLYGDEWEDGLCDQCSYYLELGDEQG